MNDRPRLARYGERDYLSAAARHLLAQRHERYPNLIAAGKLAQIDADRGLHLIGCLVAQWTWVVDASAPAEPRFDDRTGAFGAHYWEIAAEIGTAAKRAATIAARDPDSFEKRELADLYTGLAWYQLSDRARYAEPRIVCEVNAERATAFRPVPIAEAA